MEMGRRNFFLFFFLNFFSLFFFYSFFFSFFGEKMRGEWREMGG